MGWQQSLYKNLFDHEHKTLLRMVVDRLLLALIFFNLLVLLPMTLDPSFQKYSQIVQQLNLYSYLIFALEYLLRLLSAAGNPDYAERRSPVLAYVLDFTAVADLLVLIPFVAGLPLLDFRVLKLFRALEILRLSKAFATAWLEFRVNHRGQSLRRRVYALLYTTPESGRLHHYIDNFLVALILISVLSIMLESVTSIEVKLHAEFMLLDYFVVICFTLEYLLKIYAAPEHPEFASRFLGRLRYIKSFHALIDLIAIAPFYLEPLLGHLVDLRFMRVFRLVRLLKLTHYNSSLSTLRRVIVRESSILGAAGFLMLLLVLFAASLGYLFEHQAQPDKFENIPQSIYWAVITLASVGYGDLSPVTPYGRIMTIVFSVVGVGIFALPAGVLAAAFTDQLRLDRERFQHMVADALDDGVLSDEERAMIESESKRLHLLPADVDRLIQSIMRGRGAGDRRQRTESEPEPAAPVQASPAAGTGGVGLVDWQKNPELSFEQINQWLGHARLVLAASDLTQVRQLSEDPARCSDYNRQIFAKLLEQSAAGVERK